eukprot:1673860-Rhodomonas_salina.1
MSGTDTGYAASHSLCCYASAVRCPVHEVLRRLRQAGAREGGTAIAYGAMRCLVLAWRMVLCRHIVWCYAVSGTETAMSGTEIAYAAASEGGGRSARQAAGELSPYAPATRSPVLT